MRAASAAPNERRVGHRLNHLERKDDERDFSASIRNRMVCRCGLRDSGNDDARMGAVCDWWRGMDAGADMDARIGAQLVVQVGRTKLTMGDCRSSASPGTEG